MIYRLIFFDWWIVIDFGVSLLMMMCRNEISENVNISEIRCMMCLDCMLIRLSSGLISCVNVGLLI